MVVADIAFPRIVRIGSGASSELLGVLRQLNLNRPLVVSDRFLTSSGYVAKLVAPLEAAGLAVAIFSDTDPDPTLKNVSDALEVSARASPDCVVGFGGGSSMDVGKAVAMLTVHGGTMADYKAPKRQDALGLPIIAIPTTAGSGSEATRFTVITNHETDEKIPCMGFAYLPTAALLDYELTLTKPKRLTAATGLDALTHALESYVSRKATAFTKAIAISAIRLIAPSLRVAYAQPDDRAARENMMLGSFLAAIAFSNSSVALVHGMSRPIGAFFHVAHGLSNAMLLPEVTAFSVQDAMDDYAECALAMGLVPKGTETSDAVAILLRELQQLNLDLEVPSPKNYGLDEETWNRLLPKMAEQALQSGSPSNNPRIPSINEIIELYQKVWNA